MKQIIRKKSTKYCPKTTLFPYSEGKAPDVEIGSSLIAFPQITLTSEIMLAKETTHPLKGT